jgi:class 3 adenylate cyclase/predicted negative regulator of RcsB-dependent stress response
MFEAARTMCQEPRLKRKIAVILAADIAGYSRLIAEDEEETLRRFEGYRTVFSEFVDRSGGRIFNTAGDAILAEFQSAVEAVRCAVDVQESLKARNLAYPPSRHMNFRIGITIGDVVERENGDLLGDGVNIAARLESVAPPGGICVSRSVHEAVATKMTLRFSDAGPQALKNIPERVHAYTLAIEEAEPRPVTLPLLPDKEESGTPPPPVARPPRQINWTTVALSLAALVVAGLYAVKYLPALQKEEPLPLDAGPSPSASSSSPETSPATGGSSTAVAPEPATETEPAHTPPEEKTETAATTPEPDPEIVKKAPSPLASRYVLTRQWNECQESSDPNAATVACQSLLETGGLSSDDQAEITYRLGRAQRDKGEADKAVETLTRAIALNPTADAFNYRGIAYYDTGAYDKAIADYSEALRLAPTFADAINNRAWTRYKAGDLNAALDDANRAIQLDATKAYNFDTRGHINEARGSKSAAIADYRKALELDRTTETSSEGLRRLGAATN